jgi:hypothetical protein
LTSKSWNLLNSYIFPSYTSNSLYQCPSLAIANLVRNKLDFFPHFSKL